MLKILFGEAAGAVYHPPTYFDNRYEDEWITDPLSIQMIKDIDHSEVVNASLIQSPVLGDITARELSGSVKTLILLAFDGSGKIFNASVCGDDCANWIVKIGQRKDLTINLHHMMDFSTTYPFEALMLNTGRIVHSYREYVQETLGIKER